MTNIKKRLILFAIGLLLSLLPLVLAVALAEFLFLTAKPAEGVREQGERTYFAGTLVIVGLVMSAVAFCGMLLYAMDIFCRVFIVERQARKIERLKRQGKI